MQPTKTNYAPLLVMSPILCLLIVGTIAFLQYRNVTALRGEMEKADTEIAVVDQKLKEPPTGEISSRIAAVQLSAQEQPIFVNWLRETAAASHVEVSKWTNMPAPPPPTTPPPDQPKDPNAPKPLPRGIAPLICAVEVSGRYADIRDFLYLLLRSTRVVTLNGVKWTRAEKWPQTKVAFTLTRYVNTEPTASHGGA